MDQGVVRAELVLAHRPHLHRTGVDGLYGFFCVPHLNASRGTGPRCRGGHAVDAVSPIRFKIFHVHAAEGNREDCLPIVPPPGGLGCLRETRIAPGITAILAAQGEKLPLCHQAEGGGGILYCALHGALSSGVQRVQKKLLLFIPRDIGVQNAFKLGLLLLPQPGVSSCGGGLHHNICVFPGAVWEDGQISKPCGRLLQKAKRQHGGSPLSQGIGVEQPAGEFVVRPCVHSLLVFGKPIKAVIKSEHRLRLQVQPIGGNKGSEFPSARRALQVQYRPGVADGGAGPLPFIAVGVEGHGHCPAILVHLLCRHGLVQKVQVAPPAPVGGVENAVEVLVVIRGQGEETVRHLRGKERLRRLPQVRQGRDRDRLRLPGK